MKTDHPSLTLIAAVGRNGAIGKDNQLLWQLPEDMRFFKRSTVGAQVIMGRKTWESIPPRFRPLPDRRNIVVTRQRDYIAAGADVAHGLEEALALCAPKERCFVIGGAELYALALPHAHRLLLTEVDDSPAGDAFFPSFSRQDWREISRQDNVSENGIHFAFVTYERT